MLSNAWCNWLSWNSLKLYRFLAVRFLTAAKKNATNAGGFACFAFVAFSDDEYLDAVEK